MSALGQVKQEVTGGGEAMRHRFAEAGRQRLATVETVVEEARWIPQRCISDPNRQAGLKIGFEERELRARIRGVSVRWDAGREASANEAGADGPPQTPRANRGMQPAKE